MQRRWLKSLLPFVVLHSLPAAGQVSILPPRSDIAGSRPQPEFDPVGVRLASWVVSPSLGLATGYDGNVFGQDKDASSDAFFMLQPALRVASDWGRHAVTLSASGDFTRYARFAEQNTNEYDVQASGRLDVADRATLVPSFSISRVAERRGANGVPLTLGAPSLYRTITEALEAHKEFARFKLSATGRHSDVGYSAVSLPNGNEDVQRFRNSQSWEVESRVDYSSSSASALFLSARYGEGQSHGATAALSRRNSNYGVSGGVAVDGGLLRGEVTAGYLRRNFSNPLFPDFGGLVYNAQLEWVPTALVTVDLSSGRTLENSGVARVGAIVARSDRLQITYEALRNLLVHVVLSDRHDRYREIDTHTNSRRAELRADYAFNRTVAFGVYQRYECRDSSRTSSVGNYCALQAGLSLNVRR